MTSTKIIADGLKKSFFHKMLDVIFKEVNKRIEDRAGTLQKRIDVLETRDRERSFGRFLGAYQRAMLPEFRRGDAVVHDGGLWLALNDSPGELPGDGWQLVVRPRRS
jgi:hypothetical protein